MRRGRAGTSEFAVIEAVSVRLRLAGFNGFSGESPGCELDRGAAGPYFRTVSLVSGLRPHLKITLTLYLVAQVFFLLFIQFPKTFCFDEFHYVPAAKSYLQLSQNVNWEHPPLGKEILAVGIALWGDRPIGWRFMSTLFGALTLVGMYAWGWTLFRDRRTALFVGLLTFFNQFLFVQARIGMLDTFMTFFLVCASASFCWLWTTREIGPPQARRALMFMGAMFGCAIAVKWAAFIPWVALWTLFIGVRLLQGWGMMFEDVAGSDTSDGFEDWYSGGMLGGIRWRDWFLSMGVLPLVLYSLTFVPLFFFEKEPLTGVGDLIQAQWRMWDGQLRVVGEHPYNSHWSGWAWLKRPMWYAFDKEGETGDYVRGVFLVGNPWMMCTGLLALVGCVWTWTRWRARDGFLILLFYTVYYLPWALIPRKVNFYYYYYPAALTLSLALAFVAHHWAPLGPRESDPTRPSRGPALLPWAYLGVSAAVFAFFYPVLAGLRITSDSFRKWTWFQSWI